MIKILEELKNENVIGIAGHVRPDGDCVGSCMALYLYLKKNLPSNKIIHVYLEETPPNFNLWEETNLIKHHNGEMCQYDVFISLDSGSIDRLGFAREYFEQAKRTINIDHHISNTNFGDLNHVVPDASATCEVLFDLFELNNIDLECAKALYLGIVHDTGVFKYSNTTEKTMNIVGKLITKGVPFSKMIDETFYQRSYIQNQILGRCLLESMLVLDGRCVVSALSKKTMDFYGANPADLDGIIDQLRIIKGVEVAVFIYETNFHEYKVSMRSNNKVDVRKIVEIFGGGGHTKAAGCTMQGTVHDIFNNLTIQIEHQLDQ